MSNYLAVASVTASLAQYLQGVVQVDVSGSTVSTTRPDEAGNGTQNPRVNIYLYQVAPNAAWRNSDLPTRDENGQVVQRPRAAIDLHYLLTFYGNETQLEPQRLLGSVVRAIHASPVLTRGLIRQTINSPTYAYLAASTLAEDIELVKFTPTTLTLEELSRLWAVFNQTQYTLSVTYQASVVLIEEEVSTRQSQPVLERNVYAVPLRRPVIEKVKAANDGPIIAGGDLVILGRLLRGDVTLLSFGASDTPVAPAEVSDTEIKVALPAELRAGIQGLQVEHLMMIGTPPAPHRGFESNVAAFALVPVITQPAPPSFVRTSPPADGVNVKVIGGDLTVNFTPNVGKTQRVKVLLNEFNAPLDRPARAYSFNAPKDNGITVDTQTETDKIVFAIKGVIPDEYVVRVQVDGAESALERDEDKDSATYNLFIGPKVNIQ